MCENERILIARSDARDKLIKELGKIHTHDVIISVVEALTAETDYKTFKEISMTEHADQEYISRLNREQSELGWDNFFLGW